MEEDGKNRYVYNKNRISVAQVLEQGEAVPSSSAVLRPFIPINRNESAIFGLWCRLERVWWVSFNDGQTLATTELKQVPTGQGKQGKS